MHEPAGRDREQGGGSNRSIAAANQNCRNSTGLGWPLAASRYRYALQGISMPPVQVAACPFSIHVRRKLMQKIHRLTDN
jgi:hypothetical protein